ncbi:hypothetical protein Enr13x_37210 [Stieleria neptunia]|uniref:Uncharacterized protein n=1 Tax=Stieleria neptunia TaxID=2527979 RepID=A0A518HST4_9BACT|nr:hypothetical protein [Stieleria neptunia]QDV43861.1 hypothetical protein Enr13x_37210 [Stieleria neptunia]
MIQTTKGVTSGNPDATVAPDNAAPEQEHQGADYAKQRASEVSATVKQTASVKQEELKQQAAEVADVAKQKASEAAEQAKQSGAQYAREKKLRLAEEIGVFSGAIRKASGKLHDEQHDSIASYVDAAAGQLDQFRQSLESKDIGEIVDDVQDFARRRPEIVYGGLFVAGLAAMRFLKASKPACQRKVSPHDLSHHDNRPPAAFGHAPSSHPNPPRPQSSVDHQGHTTFDQMGGPTS